MRLIFDAGEHIDVNEENLADLIIGHYEELVRWKAFLLLKFYLPAKENNDKTALFMSTLSKLISELCE